MQDLKQLPEMLERVQRCRYCHREMAIPALNYAENPYCKVCLGDRIEAVEVPNTRKNGFEAVNT